MGENIESSEIILQARSPSPVLSSGRKFVNPRKRSRKNLNKIYKTEGNPDEIVITMEKNEHFLNDNTFTPSQEANILQKLDILEKVEQEKENSTAEVDFIKPISKFNDEFQGFQTAAGTKITFCTEAIKKSESLFHDILNPASCIQESSRPNKYSFLSKTKSTGWELNDDPPSELLLKKAKEYFDDCKFEYATTSTSGFSKASGKAIQFSVNALKKAQSLFKEQFNDLGNIKEESLQNKISKSKSSNCGFKRASDNALSQSEPLLKKAKTVFSEECQFGLKGGFFKASGTAIQLSEDAQKKALNFFKEEFNDLTCEKIIGPLERPHCHYEEFKGFNERDIEDSKHKSQEFSDSLDNLDKKEPNFDVSDGMSKEKALKSVTGKARALCNAKRIFKNIDHNIADKELTPEKSYDKTQSQKKKRLGQSMASCRPIQISSNKLEKAKLLFEDEKIQGFSPMKQSQIFSSTPIKKLPPINNNLSYSENNFEGGAKISIQPCTKGNVNSWYANLENELKLLEIKMKVIMQRKEALALQKILLENSPQEHKKKRMGVLLGKKQNCHHKMFLQNMLKPPFSEDVTMKIIPQNAENVHFSFPDPYLVTVKTLDGAIVIPNKHNLVGFSEISTGFKAMPGVEQNLIPKTWIKNHYKWIVWKLASYDRCTHYATSLTVENIIQQLKYRYDREIDKAERSTLRRIFEKDDAPQKRMVLCVSDIVKLENGKYELELTDGWYSIQTTIDDCLCRQIKKEKIVIGTKLIIAGAELLNCEGCHPLESSHDARLKINYNSTRRAVWYAKLGYQRFLEPFPSKLQSVMPSGGVVGCIKVYIARVYPLNFFERPVWRNQNAEEIRAQKWESERFAKLETIRENIQCEYEKRLSKTQDNSLNININDIKNISCPKTLYNLFQKCSDPESLQELFTATQREAILDYQKQIGLQQQQELHYSISKLQLKQRDVSPVLQIRIMDVLDGGSESKMLEIWRPSDIHIQILKESEIFEIYNVLPKKNGQFSSISKTKFNPAKANLEKFSKFKRMLVPIAQICDSKMKFGEFDTVGIVVQINVHSFDQQLWLADGTGRLLFIRVFEGPTSCLLFDNVKTGQIVALANLKISKSKFEFAEAIANSLTTVSSYPKMKHLQEGIDLLKRELPPNIDEFLKNCIEKINYNIDRINIIRNSKNVSQSLSESGISEFFDDNFD